MKIIYSFFVMLGILGSIILVDAIVMPDQGKVGLLLILVALFSLLAAIFYKD